jgi:hypothetical protein
MLAKIAKVLVFVNLAVSVGLVAWAVSLAFNRTDLVQKDAGASKKSEDPYADDTNNLERLQWKVEALSDSVKAAQLGYARSSTAATDAELTRDVRQGQIAVRLGEARNGSFKTFVYYPTSAWVDFNQPAQPVQGVDGKPVRGLDSVQQDLTKAIRDSDQFLGQSEQRRNSFGVLAGDVDVLDAKITKQKDILVQLKDEFDYLSDRRTDWDEQVRTLNRRKAQVAAATAALSGK